MRLSWLGGTADRLLRSMLMTKERKREQTGQRSGVHAGNQIDPTAKTAQEKADCIDRTRAGTSKKWLRSGPAGIELSKMSTRWTGAGGEFVWTDSR